MGTRLYVGNLPYEIDENELRRLFEADGRTVSQVSIVTDRDTGRPRGFAFVEMANQSDAQAAITALNGQQMGGRSIAVNEARERTGGGSGGRRGSYY
jgi:RNA recognition motif-containing protein